MASRNNNRILAIVLIAAAFAGGCASNAPRRLADPTAQATPRIQIGMASYYGKAHHGKRTANGET